MPWWLFKIVCELMVAVALGIFFYGILKAVLL